MWKAGQLFDNLPGGRDSVKFGELTNWDDYTLSILNPTPVRPAACVAADPSSPLCQLEGSNALRLNNYAQKTPYADMAERCPSRPPKYEKPANC